MPPAFLKHSPRWGRGNLSSGILDGTEKSQKEEFKWGITFISMVCHGKATGWYF